MKTGLYRNDSGRFMIVTSVGSKYAYAVCMQAGQLESKASTPDCWEAKGYKPHQDIGILQAIDSFLNHFGGLSAIATKELLTLKEIEMNVKTATSKELLEFHNKHATKPVKKFADRKTAEKRVTALIGKPAPASKTAAPCSAKAKKPQAPKPAAKRVTVVVQEGKRKPFAPAEFRSVLKAFEHFGLPIGIHKTFRATLKKTGKNEIEHDGSTYGFSV